MKNQLATRRSPPTISPTRSPKLGSPTFGPTNATLAFLDIIDSDINAITRLIEDAEAFRTGLYNIRTAERGKGRAQSPSANTDPRSGTDPRSEQSYRSADYYSASDLSGEQMRRLPGQLSEEQRAARRGMARGIMGTARVIQMQHDARLASVAEHDKARGGPPSSRLNPRLQREDPLPLHPGSRGGSTQSDSIPATGVTAESIYGTHGPTYIAAWKRYVSAWDAMTKKNRSSNRVMFSFSTFPWPTVVQPKVLTDLTRDNVANFIQHGPPSFNGLAREETRLALHEAVRTWHPDRSAWVPHVNEEDRAMTQKGADIVIRILNQLSSEASERTSPPLQD